MAGYKSVQKRNSEKVKETRDRARQRHVTAFACFQFFPRDWTPGPLLHSSCDRSAAAASHARGSPPQGPRHRWSRERAPWPKGGCKRIPIECFGVKARPTWSYFTQLGSTANRSSTAAWRRRDLCTLPDTALPGPCLCLRTSIALVGTWKLSENETTLKVWPNKLACGFLCPWSLCICVMMEWGCKASQRCPRFLKEGVSAHIHPLPKRDALHNSHTLGFWHTLAGSTSKEVRWPLPHDVIGGRSWALKGLCTVTASPYWGQDCDTCLELERQCSSTNHWSKKQCKFKEQTEGALTSHLPIA